jgi:hypothetical protein
VPEVGRFILRIIFIPSSFYTVKHFLLLYKNYEGSRKELKEVGERNMPGRTDR